MSNVSAIKQQKIAICVGLNQYPGTDMDLSGCLNDLRDWAKLFKSWGFAVLTLSDSKATKQNIVDAITAVMKKLNAGDQFYIQYSGHGSQVPDTTGNEADGLSEVWCPWDIMKQKWISDDDLNRMLRINNEDASRKIVVFSDSCHSGTMMRFNPIVNMSPSGKRAPMNDRGIRKVRYLPPSLFLKNKSVLARLVNDSGNIIPCKKSRIGEKAMIDANSPIGLLIGGAADNEYSYDASFFLRPNGAFTHAAIKSYEKLKKNATFGDWHKAIRKMLPTRSYPQSPTLYCRPGIEKWKIVE